MNNSLIILLSALCIASFALVYYREYRVKSKVISIKTGMLGFLKGLLLYGIALLFLGILYKVCIPFNKSHGMTYNDKREQLGLPILTSEWDEYKNEGNQFTTIWWKSHPRTGHFKKEITYNFWNAVSETDYYQSDQESKKGKGTLAWSIYNFEQNTFEYYIRVPLKEPIQSQQGEWQVLQENEVKIINKEEFNRYIKELH